LWVEETPALRVNQHGQVNYSPLLGRLGLYRKPNGSNPFWDRLDLDGSVLALKAYEPFPAEGAVVFGLNQREITFAHFLMHRRQNS
jgi:hypothetical protein